MPMKNPPHPGLSRASRLSGAPGAQRDGGSAQARRQPQTAFGYRALPFACLARDGDPYQSRPAVAGGVIQ